MNNAFFMPKPDGLFFATPLWQQPCRSFPRDGSTRLWVLNTFKTVKTCFSIIFHAELQSPNVSDMSTLALSTHRPIGCDQALRRTVLHWSSQSCGFHIASWLMSQAAVWIMPTIHVVIHAQSPNGDYSFGQ